MEKNNKRKDNLDVGSKMVADIRRNQKIKYRLQKGVAILLGAIVVAGCAIGIKKSKSNRNYSPNDLPPSEITEVIMPEDELSELIAIEDLDFKNTSVAIVQSGEQGAPIVKTLKNILADTEVEHLVTRSYEEANDFIEQSTKDKKVAVDINGYLRHFGEDVVLTKYSNEERLNSDIVALAIKHNYGIGKEIEIRAGKTESDKRMATDLERRIDDETVAVVTLAINEAKEWEERDANSCAVSIYEAIAKFSITDEQSLGQSDILRRAEPGETPEEYTEKYQGDAWNLENNYELTVHPDKLIRIGKETPKILSSKTRVANPKNLVVNEDEITWEEQQYVVQAGDTLSEIRDKFDNHKIGSGLEDKNNIQIGQTLKWVDQTGDNLLVNDHMHINHELIVHRQTKNG